jgi:hypothetical protein
VPAQTRPPEMAVRQVERNALISPDQPKILNAGAALVGASPLTLL